MNNPPPTDADRRKGLRHAILAQCAGMPGSLVFTNGIMLSYLAVLGFSNAATLTLLALPQLLICLLLIPFAFLADRVGLHRLGKTGLVATVAGFALITAAGGTPPAVARVGTMAGIILFALGLTSFEAGWFPLIHLLVPSSQRGRFFGRLRVAWQSVAVLLTFGATLWLRRDASLYSFQWVLFILTLLLLLRVRFYSRIPRLRDRAPGAGSFRQALIRLIGQPGYLSFGSYVFLLTLFTSACPWIFSLLQKETLGFSADQIVLMGNLLFVGAVAGFFFGGRFADFRGLRFVFISCHALFVGILFLFPLRIFSPFSMPATMGLLSIAFGAIQAASSIAITSEILALIPAEDRALAASLATVMLASGKAAAGLIAALIVHLGVLSDTWMIFGYTMSAYDTMLLGCGVMLALLSVTIGLIPAVIRNRRMG